MKSTRCDGIAAARVARDDETYLCVPGSSDGTDPSFATAAATLGAALARAGLGVVYGGARAGLMGRLADGALGAGGAVTGVMPRALARYEVQHLGLHALEWTDDLRARKQRMADQADAFIALPGGLGTIEETLEVVNLKLLRLHAKPIVLVDVAGYFGPLLAMLDAIAAAGFAPVAPRTLVTVVPSVEAAVAEVQA